MRTLPERTLRSSERGTNNRAITPYRRKCAGNSGRRVREGSLASPSGANESRFSPGCEFVKKTHVVGAPSRLPPERRKVPQSRPILGEAAFRDLANRGISRLQTRPLAPVRVARESRARGSRARVRARERESGARARNQLHTPNTVGSAKTEQLSARSWRPDNLRDWVFGNRVAARSAHDVSFAVSIWAARPKIGAASMTPRMLLRGDAVLFISLPNVFALLSRVQRFSGSSCAPPSPAASGKDAWGGQNNSAWGRRPGSPPPADRRREGATSLG